MEHIKIHYDMEKTVAEITRKRKINKIIKTK